MIRLSALAAAALLAVAPAGARAECKLGKLLTMPVTMVGSKPSVEVRLDGRPVRLEVDSGAFFSTLSTASVAELKLRSEPAPYNFHVMGIGGEAKTVDIAKARFGIGTQELKNIPFVVVPGLQGEYGIVGLLGRNVLATYDVDYDFAKGEISLMKAQDCGGRSLAYWTTGAANVLPLLASDNPALRPAMAWIKINGHDVKVMFDTGASSSGMTLAAARRIGLDVHAPGAVEAGFSHGIGQHVAKRWIVPIGELRLGDEIIKNTRVAVADYSGSTLDHDMLIGADFFLSHHVLIANTQQRIYFTYNGGPVFDLRAPKPDGSVGTAAVAPPPGGGDGTGAAAAVAAVGSDEPKDADGFSRRGQARLARRDAAGALTDLTRAVELDPSNARYLRERAQVRLLQRQPFLAMNDLDAALKLAPDDPETLLVRARLRASGRDRTGEEADLEAADRIAAKPADVRFSLAAAWTSLGRYDRAVSDYDQWLQFHDGDARQPAALNGRCWTRALANSALDQALRDCDAALRAAPKSAAYLDSRGLTHLRRGEWSAARADYDAALQLNPKLAWALYGRGVVKTHTGDAEGGRADMAAATALNASVAEDAKRIGVTPA